MNLEYKYCTVCGSKLENGEIKSYDPFTGKPEYEKICSKNKCHYPGHLFKKDYELAKFRIGNGYYHRFYYKCEQCGKEIDIKNFLDWKLKNRHSRYKFV